MSLFAMQHSVMARPQFKQWWTQFVPKPVERSTYVLFASLCLALLFWQWRPIPAVIWQVEIRRSPSAMIGLSLVGWLIVLTSTFLINHFELFGLHQVANNLAGRDDAGADSSARRSSTSSCGTRSISASSSRSGRRRR